MKTPNNAVLIDTDGKMSVLSSQPSIAECHQLIGTDILERTQVIDPSDGRKKWMWLDESGHLRSPRLPINLAATVLYRNQRDTIHFIVGKVIVFTGWQGPKATR